MRGFPSGSGVKNPPAMLETMDMRVPSLGLGRSPGGGNGPPLQYSCPIPWAEEPVGSQRVGHNRAIEHPLHQIHKNEENGGGDSSQ